MTRFMDQQISLQDTRFLGYSEIGPSGGRPVFYAHGFPGSRLDAIIAEDTAVERDIRIIGIDRPGYGLSGYQPCRTLVDWPDDLTALANTLGIERFSVVGVSGGGPYAAACAWKIPERLISVGIICGLGPLNAPHIMDGMILMNRWGLHLARRSPFLTALVFKISAFMLRNHSEYLVRRLAARVKGADRNFLKRKETAFILASSFRESVRQGFSGPLHDLMLYSRPWDFRPEDIRMPVHLWHGMQDTIVPPGMGRFMSRTIPQCRRHFYEDEGHFSILANRLDEILCTLMGPL